MTLPKLSKAQAEAWKRVLEWYLENSGPFYAAGVGDFAVKIGKRNGNGIPGTDATFNALVKKGMLEHAGSYLVNKLYTIHPDYLPTDDQDAAPEAVGEPQIKEAPEMRFSVGDMVTPLVGMWTGATCEVVKVWVDMFNINRYMIKDVMGRDGVISYKDNELAPVTPDTPETIESLDTERAAVLDAMMASYEVRIAELESENARLRVFLTVIKDEAETDLDDWLGVAFDQVIPSKQAMKVIYENARNALNPSEDNS